MSRWILAGVGMAALIGAAQLDLHAEPRPAAQHEAAAEVGTAEARALLNRYCVACHNRRTLTAGLALDTLDVAQVETNAATWEHVIRRLRANAMPPAGRPRPTAAATHGFIEWLETELDRTGLENPDPGRPAVHRLNRAEYANAIRDIFGLEIDVNALLPADDEQEGFDNIAEVLSVSPTLIERYLAAARRISQLVVGDTSLRAVSEVYPIHGAVDQDGPVSDDLPFGSRGGVAIEHHFPVDGEYIIRFSLRKQEYGYVRGLGRAHELDVRVDGERVGGFTVGRDWEQGSVRRWGTPASSRASTTRAPSRNGSSTPCTPTRGWKCARRSPPAATRSDSPSTGARRCRRGFCRCRSTARRTRSGRTSSRKETRASPRCRSSARTTPAARPGCRAGSACSSASRPAARRTRSAARARSSPRWRGRPIAGRPPRRMSIRCCPSTATAAPREASTPASRPRSSGSWSTRSSCSASRPILQASPRARRTVWPTWSSRRACPSSSGAAFPTTSCSTSLPRAG